MSERTPWPWPLTALSFVGSLVFLLLLKQLTLPGVDPQAFPDRHVADVVLDSSATLVVLRGLADLVAAFAPQTRDAGRRVAALLFFVLVAVQAWAMVGVLERMNNDVVYAPGRAFELGAMATLVGVQGIVWLLADLIGRSGRLHGASAIYGIFVWFWLIMVVRGAGANIAMAFAPPWYALMALGLVMPVVVALVGALGWPNAHWPLRLPGGVRVFSGLDLALVSVTLGSLVSAPFELVATQIAKAMAIWPKPMVTPVVATVVVLLVLAAYGSVREEGPREWRLAVPLFLLPLMATGALLNGFFSNGGAHLFDPGPYDGDADLSIELESTSHAGQHDADVIDKRLSALGVHADVRSRDPDHIRVYLHRVKATDKILEAVLPSRQLVLRMVAKGQADGGYADPTPVPASIPGVHAASCDDDGHHCVTWILDDPPVLTNADIADAGVAFDQNSQPVVSITLTPAGAQRFAAATRAAVGERLAIVVDGRIMSMPVIRQAITGGRVSIEMGAQPGDHVAEAEALAAAMKTGALAGRWKVASIDAGP